MPVTRYAPFSLALRLPGSPLLGSGLADVYYWGSRLCFLQQQGVVGVGIEDFRPCCGGTGPQGRACIVEARTGLAKRGACRRREQEDTVGSRSFVLAVNLDA